MGSWRPERSHEERLGRAIQSMIPGTLQGRIAQASPIDRRDRGRHPMMPEDVEGLEANDLVFTQETFILTKDGAQTIELAYEPEPGSEHVYWNGLYQPASEWDRSGQTITVSDGGGFLQAGDELAVEYAYRVGFVAPSDLQILVPWAASGWSYLQVTLTDATDRSAVAFDDSAWTVGQAPFGVAIDVWPLPPASPWALDTALWLRRHITLPAAGATVTVSLRVDNYAKAYWNGTLIYDSGVTTPVDITVAVPPALVLVDNVLAVHAIDDAATGVDNTYADVRVTLEA